MEEKTIGAKDAKEQKDQVLCRGQPAMKNDEVEEGS